MFHGKSRKNLVINVYIVEREKSVEAEPENRGERNNEIVWDAADIIK